MRRDLALHLRHTTDCPTSLLDLRADAAEGADRIILHDIIRLVRNLLHTLFLASHLVVVGLRLILE